MIYSAFNKAIIKYIPDTSEKILDLGCGSGILGKEIKKKLSCEVIGVTSSKNEFCLAKDLLNQVILGDLNSPDFYAPGKYDCVICSHVLEHLCQPQILLEKLHSNLNSNGILIVALPNILHWKQRWEFTKGNFKYTEGGLMDETHLRFFDWETAQELLVQTNYRILTAEADGNFPLPGVRRLLVDSVASSIDQAAVQIFPGLFGFQFIFSCESKLAK